MGKFPICVDVFLDEVLSLDRGRVGPAESAAAQAATHDDRPLLIVAGAGTGKTATLVQRVAWLIARGVEPSRILLLTFTRRAAAEMLRRVDNLLRHLDAARPRKRRTRRRCRRRVVACHRRRFAARGSGAAPFMPSPRGCSAATARRSACRPISPSTIAAIPRTC